MSEAGAEMCACGFPKYRHAAGKGPCSHSRCQLFRPVSDVGAELVPFKDGDVAGIGKAWAVYLDALAKAQQAFDRELARLLTGIPRAVKPSHVGIVRESDVERVDDFTVRHRTGAEVSISDGLTRSMRRVLTVLAQHAEGMPRDRIAIFAGYSATSGGFSQALADLRAEGWIEDAAGCSLITDEGIRALGTFEPLPTGSKLFAYWIANLSTSESRILVALRDRAKQGLARDELADACGYSPTSGGFSQALADLRLRKLIVDVNKRIHIAKELL